MKRQSGTTDFDRKLFDLRLSRNHADLFGMLERLYGKRSDYPKFAASLEKTMRKAWSERPEDLKWLDLKRDLEPDWFQRPDMNGYVFYIDRFAKDLKGVAGKLDYFTDLGISYVHFMPCMMPRAGDNDGGYSVQDYRSVDPKYGSMEDFEAVAALLRRSGISLCVDLVVNHTAKEHEWAAKALKGVKKYRDYYLMFDTEDEVKAYEKNLVEVFPENAPGSFTYYPEMKKWVWTTFNEHQWDLNWANPWVFLEMVDIMLFWANKGVDVLRFDAVAFMWKRMGTRCQSEPEVHSILQAMRSVSRIAAAALIHLEEAIVSPAEMIPYLGRGEHDGKEGNLAYHNSLMVQFWSTLASRDTRLMTYVLDTHFPTVLTNATYANYIRCHDDIGWAITDEDAAAVGLRGESHRAFLSDFYEGVFPGSFSRGALFQQNPDTGDKRISGTFASLAGLERAEAEADRQGIASAIDRILLGQAIISSFGGIPLIYMGDEVALLNDYNYRLNPDHAHDSRWVHRPRMDWNRIDMNRQAETVASEVFTGIRHILARRRSVAEFHARNPTIIADTGKTELFAFIRRAPTGSVICIFNFTEKWTHVDLAWARLHGATELHDALSDNPVHCAGDRISLPPYARLWLR